MQFPENATADSFRKEIRTLADGLRKFEASESKYAAELNDALKQYAELQEQATEFDPIELHEARMDIRSEQERNAVQRAQNAYGDRYDILRMYDSKRSVSYLLGEEVEERSLMGRLQEKQKEQKQQQTQRKTKYYERER